MNAGADAVVPRERTVSRSAAERVRGVGTLTAVYGMSRSLGLAREVGVAYYFGTTIGADRLSAAMVIATLTGTLVGEMVYVGALRRASASADAGPAFARGFRAAFSVALAAGAVFALAGPVVTAITLGGLGEYTHVVWLSLLLTPVVVGMVASAGFNAQLTYQGRLALQTGAQMLYSTGALVALGLFVSGLLDPSVNVVAVGWATGNLAAACLLALVVGRHAGGGHGARFSARDLLRVGAPFALAYSLLGLQTLVAQGLAARLGHGHVAALNYADRLFLLPIGFVLAAVGPMVLGNLAAAGSVAVGAAAGPVVARQLRVLGAVIAPCALAFAALSPLLVRVVFHYGAFNGSSVTTTTAALDGLSIGIAAIALVLAIVRILQGTVDTRRIVQVTASSLGLFCVLGPVGVAALGIFGLTLAWSVVAVITVAFQLEALRRHFGHEWALVAARPTFVRVTLVVAVAALVVALDHFGGIGTGLRAALLLVIAAAAVPAAVRTAAAA